MSRFTDLGVTSRLLVQRGLLRTLRALGDPGAALIAAPPGTNPYPRYEALRQQGPLVHSRLGMYVTPSHELCDKVLRDNRFGTLNTIDLNPAVPDIRTYGAERLVSPLDDSFLCRNPPDHTRLRRLVSPVFTPRALSKRTASVEKIVRDTLDQLPDDRPFDLVSEFASAVPIKVMCDMLGVPDAERAKFVQWSSTLTIFLDGIRTVRHVHALRQTLTELNRLFDDLIAERRLNPGPDMISELLAVDTTEDPLTSEELLGIAELLLLAGFETLMNLIGSSALVLMGNPDIRARVVAEPDLAQLVVEEVLRLESPVQFVVRMAQQPVTLAGVELPTDARVMLILGAANRDPEAFAHPDQFDIDRANNRDHLAFASGIHHCLGASLVRIEAAQALRALCERFPHLHLAGDVTRKPSRIFWGAQRMPVTAV